MQIGRLNFDATSLIAQDVVRKGITLGSIVILAIICAKSFYLILSGPSASLLPSTNSNVGTNNSSDVSIDIGMLARLTPFSGQLSASDLENTIVSNQPDAPETELNIVLNGVRADGNGAGVAFISSGNNQQQRYQVGDNIAGLQGVSVESIYSDGVLLSRSGRIERLSNLHDEKIGIKSVNVSNENQRSKIPTVDQAREARERDKQKNTQPAQNVSAGPTLATATMKKTDLEDILGWARWDENTVNNVQGVTVFPLDTIRFSRSGLKTRDIVQKIQGVEIDNVADFESLKATLENAQQIRIELLRNQEIVHLTVNVSL